MPSRKEMEGLLRLEGWSLRRVYPLGLNRMVYAWKDPVACSHLLVEAAYRIAQKRKAARETRRLKAAGFRFFSGLWWRGDLARCDFYTRAEALQTLAEGPEAASAKGSKSPSPSQKGPQ